MFSFEIMSTLKAIKSHFKHPYDKQYEIFENVTCNYDAIVLELIVYLIIVDFANSENYKQYIYATPYFTENMIILGTNIQQTTYMLKDSINTLINLTRLFLIGVVSPISDRNW